MRATCEWLIEGEVPCGKPAVAFLRWPGGKEIVYWYCAEHFDERVKFLRECERMDILRASGVR